MLRQHTRTHPCITHTHTTASASRTLTRSHYLSLSLSHTHTLTQTALPCVEPSLSRDASHETERPTDRQTEKTETVKRPKHYNPKDESGSTTTGPTKRDQQIWRCARADRESDEREGVAARQRQKRTDSCEIRTHAGCPNNLAGYRLNHSAKLSQNNTNKPHKQTTHPYVAPTHSHTHASHTHTQQRAPPAHSHAHTISLSLSHTHSHKLRSHASNHRSPETPVTRPTDRQTDRPTDRQTDRPKH